MSLNLEMEVLVQHLCALCWSGTQLLAGCARRALRTHQSLLSDAPRPCAGGDHADGRPGVRQLHADGARVRRGGAAGLAGGGAGRGAPAAPPRRTARRPAPQPPRRCAPHSEPWKSNSEGDMLAASHFVTCRGLCTLPHGCGAWHLLNAVAIAVQQKPSARSHQGQELGGSHPCADVSAVAAPDVSLWVAKATWGTSPTSPTSWRRRRTAHCLCRSSWPPARRGLTLRPGRCRCERSLAKDGQHLTRRPPNAVLPLTSHMH
jgi:hypothetical protein